MAGKNTAAYGIYSNEATAEAAVDQLIAGGFSNDDVSVLMSDVRGSRASRPKRTRKLLKELQPVWASEALLAGP